MSSTANRRDLARRTAEKTGHTVETANLIIEEFLDQVQEAVASGEKVALLGFGTFAAREQAARTARNPRTGEEIPVAAKMVPAFKVGIPFKERVKDAAPKA